MYKLYIWPQDHIINPNIHAYTKGNLVDKAYNSYCSWHSGFIYTTHSPYLLSIETINIGTHLLAENTLCWLFYHIFTTYSDLCVCIMRRRVPLGTYKHFSEDILSINCWFCQPQCHYLFVAMGLVRNVLGPINMQMSSHRI